MGTVRPLRRWKRTHVQIPVEITDERGRRRGRICDITAHGAGLVCEPGLEKDDAVTLELGCCRTVAARVRWRLGMRAGVSFDDVLAASDPLLRGIDAAAAAPPMPLVDAAPPKSDERMMRRACREQGFAWLTDLD